MVSTTAARAAARAEIGAAAKARAAATPAKRRGGGGGGGRRGPMIGSTLCLARSVLVVLLGSSGVGVRIAWADDSLNVAVSEAFVFAGSQLKVLTDEVLVEEGVFTDYTTPDGQWLTEKESGDPIDQTVWTSGMVAGMFWYQYEATGNEDMKTAAEFYCSGLEGVEITDDNDLGFQVLNSFGLGYRLSNSTLEQEDYQQRVFTGAETLYAEKWDANIPAFWSWAEPDERPDWERAVNIDMMMNLEIMLWTGANGGEDYNFDVADHADTTWDDIVRKEDNSTNHVAAYDIDTGELLETGTYQGYSNSSTWSRGQAWAVYGFAMVYRYLQEPRFLDRSLGLLGYWEANLPEDYVPPADFDAPVSPTDNGKDSSATAIVASALLELFLETEDPIYLVKSQAHLSALLSESYFMPDATDGYQSILRRAMREWGDSDGEIGAVFGDYFLLETMVRYKKLAPSILLWQETAVEGIAVERRRLLPLDTASLDYPQQEEKEEGGEEEEEESQGTRRLQQVLLDGEFCSLTVSGGTVAFADPDCIPMPPDFSDLISASTPSPSVSDGGGLIATPVPTTGSRGDVPTMAPGALSPLSPGETLAPATPAPTAAEAPSTVLSVPNASFGATLLDNDVDLSYLDVTSPIIVWLSVTLDSTSNTPDTLTLENADGDILVMDIQAPDEGWKIGSNSVRFEWTVVTFVPAAWTSVVTVVLGFAASPTAAADALTTATMNWLVVTNELVL